MSRRPAQPGLYTTDDSEPPRLYGCRCERCGYVFFPPHVFGCERCGAPGEETAPAELRGEGVLDSFATVHLHRGGGIEAPFTVGEIVLDDGPMVRAVLADGEGDAWGQGLEIGGRMRAVLVSLDQSEEEERVELRFAPAEAEED